MREHAPLERWPFPITHHATRTTHRDRQHQDPDVNNLTQYQTRPASIS
jgi:hypothetical protein